MKFTTPDKPDAALTIRSVVKTEQGYKYLYTRQAQASTDPSKTSEAGKVNALLRLASRQPTLGAALKAAGFDKVSTSSPGWTVETKAAMLLLGSLKDSNFLTPTAFSTLFEGLSGKFDESLIPFTAKLKAFLNIGADTSIQKSTGSAMTLRQALDQLGLYDKAAADLVADRITVAQAKFAEEYYTGLLSTFASALWRGFKKTIQVVADGTKEAAAWAAEAVGAAAGGLVKGLTSAIPWYVLAGGVLVLGVVVYPQIKPLLSARKALMAR